MSREVKRVPLDFEWPLNEVWPGYVRPDLPECKLCRGSGYTAGAMWLQAIVNLILIAGEHGKGGGRLHPYLAMLENRPDAMPPSRDLGEVCDGLAGRQPSLGFHDAIDCWTATKKIVAAAGVDPDTWGTCSACGGDGDDATPEQKAENEAWERSDPPEGEGWQLWETVSEGSPVTPVFRTAAQLVDHLVVVEGYRRSAAEALVEQVASFGTFIGVGSEIFDSAKDADYIREMTKERE
jgi:hypothetical protein